MISKYIRAPLQTLRNCNGLIIPNATLVLSLLDILMTILSLKLMCSFLELRPSSSTIVFFLLPFFSTILQMTLSWKRYRNFWEIAKSEYSSEKGHFKRSGNCITYSLHKLFCRRWSPYFRNLLYLFFFFPESQVDLLSAFSRRWTIKAVLQPPQPTSCNPNTIVVAMQSS